VKDGIPHVQPTVKLLEQMVTVRIHLDPTDADNGALRVIPDSHRRGRLNPASIAEFTAAKPHTCDCQAGAVLLMSPLILHSSKRSTRPDHRRILHFEYAPTNALDARLSWHEQL
jgi:ectoine hydroxylase-related dioxygenase (phytanoyl-CoA dioxygenase family)